MLHSARLRQHRVHQLERHDLREFSQMPGREHTRSHLDHPGNDRLIPQRDSTLQMIFADI